MRTVYLGTSEFAAIVLEALAASAHRPALVITRPDRPRGRGRRLQSPPVAERARALGLQLRQPATVNDDEGRAAIAAAAPETVVVCAFGAMIREPLLSEHLMLNVHPSLLPRWRGAAPVERAIIAGDERTGATIMRVTAELDSGPVALAAEEPIGAQDTYGTLSVRLAALGAGLLLQALDAGPAQLTFTEQDGTAATYADKITAEDRLLDPAATAQACERRVRALTPHIGAAVLTADGERLGVLAATARARRGGDPTAGELAFTADEVLLGCGEQTTLALDVVQPPGRRAMDAAAFLRGRRS
ncbi:MAG TPA: methionyl-tRNA formyltransferase [Solirubrobacteraceae bacterium]|nr:methionyl-tRNA formyltransferase [Solirubrobacteraceae bacterium]